MLRVVFFLQFVQELVVALDELLDPVDDGIDILRDGDRDGLSRLRLVEEVVGDAARDEAVLIDDVLPAVNLDPARRAAELLLCALHERGQVRQGVRRLVEFREVQVVHELRRTFVERLDADDIASAAVLVVDAERPCRGIISRVEVRLVRDVLRSFRRALGVLYAAREIVQRLLVFHEILERILDVVDIVGRCRILVREIHIDRRIAFIDDGIRAVRIVDVILLHTAGAGRRQLIDALESDVGKLGRQCFTRIIRGTRDRRVRHEIGVRRELFNRDRVAHDRRRTVRIDRDRLVVRT